jgi:hypothetical protein
MIYIAIDNSTPTAKKMVDLIEEMPFATIYRDFNNVTKEAFREIEEGETITAKNTKQIPLH